MCKVLNNKRKCVVCGRELLSRSEFIRLLEDLHIFGEFYLRHDGEAHIRRVDPREIVEQ